MSLQKLATVKGFPLPPRMPHPWPVSVETGVDCPQCGRVLPDDRRFVVWCRHCGWNVDPAPAVRAPEPAWLVEREGRLAEALAQGRLGGRERSAAAFLLSLPVLAVPLPGLLGGLALAAFYRPFWVSIPLAAIAFTLTAIFRPRINRLPAEAQAVLRDDAPQLYDVLDRLAAQTGTPRLTSVLVTVAGRVAVERIGWTRRRVLLIGLPAWSVLAPQERYAAIAHALNDDQRGVHDRVLGAAEHILTELNLTVTPGVLDEAPEWRMGTWEGEAYIGNYSTEDQIRHSYLTKLGNALFGPPIRGYRRMLRKLNLPGRQRREYRIDRRVAELTGSEPTARSLERVLLAGTCFRALQRAVRFNRDGDPLEVLRRTAAEIPDHELDRQLHVDRLRNGRVDADHPPTWRRTQLLRANPTATTAVHAPSRDDELTKAARHAIAYLKDHD
jgi:hypothetical protein